MPNPTTSLLVASFVVSLCVGAACSGGGVASHLVPETTSEASNLEPQLRAAIRREGASAERYTRLAGAQLRLGKLRAARASVQRAIGLDAAHVEAMVMGARVALADKDSDQALRYYERAVTAKPAARDKVGKQWAKTLLLVANERADAGSAGGVMAAIDKLDSRLPGQARDFRKERAVLLTKAARLYLLRGDSERGSQALTRARIAGADSEELLFLGAANKLAKDDTAGARADFERWVKLDPKPQRWAQVAEMGRAQRRYALALEALNRSSPSTDEELRTLAEVALGARKPEDAANAWRKLAATKKAAGGAGAAAAILMEGGRELEDRAYVARASALYAEAVALTPGDWGHVKGLVQFLVERLERPAEVPKLVQTHLEATGWSTESVAAGVDLLVASQQVIAASKLVAQARTKPNASPELQLLAARLAHVQQNTTERERAMQAYVQSNPDSLDVLAKAGRAWLEFKVLTPATVLAKKAYALAPGDPRAALLLADVHRAARASGPEQAVLQAYLSKAPDKHAAALEVGRRFYQRQDFRTAIRHLTTATRSKDAKIRLDAHKQLFKLYFEGKKSSRGMAAPHLRSWLALIDDPTKRTELLRDLLATTHNNTSVRAVRQAVINELLVMTPNDPVLLAELGQAQLGERRFTEARATFDKALLYSKNRAADAQRFGLAFATFQRDNHALHFYEKVSPEELEGRAEGHLRMGERFDKFARRDRATLHYKLYLRWALKRPNTNVLKGFGNSMLTKRRPRLAARGFEAALEKSPKDRESQRGLGRALLKLGDLEPARLVFDRFIAAAGRSKFAAMRDVATEFRKAGALDDAARVMEEMFIKNRRGRRASLYHDINYLYRRMGALDKIRRLGRRFLDLNNHDPNTVLIVANALGAAGLWGEGYAMLTDALDPPKLGGVNVGGRTKARRKPRGKSLRLLLQAAGDMALRRQQLAVALEHYRGYALGPQSRPADWSTLAARIASAGHPAAAAEFLSYPLDKDLMDGDPKFFLERGTYRMEAGAMEDAHNDFLEAITRTLNVSEMLPVIENIYRKHGQLRRLRRVLARAIQMAPTRSQLFLSLGKLLLEGGRTAEAGQAFKRYLTAKERGQIDVARAYAAAGFPKKALGHYELAYEHMDSPGVGLREVATLLTQLGMTDRLSHHVQRYLLVSKSPKVAFREVGQVWENIARDPKRALSWYRRAAESSPSRSNDDHLRIGRLAWLAGDTQTAEREFRLHLNATMRSASSLASAVKTIVDLYAVRRDFKGAGAILDYASALRGSTELVAIRTELLVLQGRVSDALELVQRHPTLLNKAGPFMAAVARTLADQGRLEEALSLVDDALAVTRHDAVLRLQLELRAQLGLVEDAAETGRAMVVSGEPSFHLGAGSMLFQEGIIGPATKHFAIVLEEGLDNYDPNRSRDSGKLEVVSNAMTLMIRAESYLGRPMTLAQKITFIKERVRTGDDLLTQDKLIGATLHALGHYKPARDAALRGLSRLPTDSELQRLLLVTSIMLSDPSSLLVTIDSNPGMRDGRLAMRAAEMASAMNHPRFALAMVEHVLKRKGGNLRYLRSAVDWALQAGDDAAVEAFAVKFAQAQEQSKRAYVHLAAMAAQHGYVAHAQRWAKQAEGATGIDAHALRLLHLGLAVRSGDTASIKKASAAVMELAPDKRIARLQVVDLMSELDGPGALTLEVLGALVDDPSVQAKTLFMAAEAAWKGGKLKQAHEVFDRATTKTPLNRRQAWAVAEGLIRAAMRAGDIEGLNKIIGAFQDRVGGRFRQHLVSGLHQLLLDVRRVASEEQDLPATTQRAVAELLAQGILSTKGRGWSPENLSVLESTIDELQGQQARSHQALEERLAEDPANTTVANNLAYSLAEAKVDLPRALKMIDRALLIHLYGKAQYEASPTFLDTKAWVLYQMGRYKEALTVQQYAVFRGGGGSAPLASGALKGLREMMPLFQVTTGDELEMLYHLGMIEKANGLTQRAMQTFRDCARRAPGRYFAKRCKAELGAPAR